MKTLAEIIARLAEIDTEVRAASDAAAVEKLAVEKKELLERKAELEELEQRKQGALGIATGKITPKPIEARGAKKDMADRHDTEEYR